MQYNLFQYLMHSGSLYLEQYFIIGVKAASNQLSFFISEASVRTMVFYF